MAGISGEVQFRPGEALNPETNGAPLETGIALLWGKLQRWRAYGREQGGLQRDFSNVANRGENQGQESTGWTRAQKPACPELAALDAHMQAGQQGRSPVRRSRYLLMTSYPTLIHSDVNYSAYGLT